MTIKSSDIQCVADEHCAKPFTIEREGKSYEVLAYDQPSAERAVTEWLQARTESTPHPEIFE